MNGDKFLWDQFAKLGEMIGDGLHHEPDGKWISKEYKKLSRILIPEIREAESKRRSMINKVRNEKIAEFLKDKNCPECNGILLQTRSGSKKVKCTQCGNRYVISTKKK